MKCFKQSFVDVRIRTVKDVELFFHLQNF
jgi:hypothetical protein